MSRAIFIGGLAEITKPILLTSPISIGNDKQDGGNLIAFIELINNNKNKIETLVLIDTSYLHRHYENKFSNLNEPSDWLTRNEKTIKELKVNYKVKNWYDIVKSKEYEEAHKKILLDYSGNSEGNQIDEAFRKIVEQLASEYIHKGTRKAVIRYILEECAGALSLHGEVTYPGEFNAAIKYVLTKYKSDVKLIRYRLKVQKESKKEVVNSNLSSTQNFFASPHSPAFFTQMPVQSNTTAASSPANARDLNNIYQTGSVGNLSLFALSVGYIAETFHVSAYEQPHFFSEFIKFCMSFTKLQAKQLGSKLDDSNEATEGEVNGKKETGEEELQRSFSQ